MFQYFNPTGCNANKNFKGVPNFGDSYQKLSRERILTLLKIRRMRICDPIKIC